MDPSAASGPEAHRHSGPLSDAERAEYDRLRSAEGLRHRRLRQFGASVLLVLAILLAPVSVVATWVNSEVNDTDRYEQTVSPLARNPAVQSLVIDRVTDRLIDVIDARRITEDLADDIADTLADRDAPSFVVDAAKSLDGPLQSGLTTVVHYVVQKVVTSDQFATAWDEVNRRAHSAVSTVLTGEGGGVIEAKGDTIVLNVGTVIDEMQEQLLGTKVIDGKNIPGVDKSIVLVRNDNLGEAQDAARLLGILGVWLPVAVVVLAALGVWVAPSHRVALMAAGFGVGVMMCALLVALAVMRVVGLDAVPPDAQTQDAAASVYDTLVRFLRQAAVTVLVVALITVAAGYLYGPGQGARAVRSPVARGTEAAGHALARSGLRTGAVGRWLHTHRPVTTTVVVAAGALVLFLWDYPTPASVVLVLVLVVVVLAVLGVLGAADGAAADTEDGPPDAGPGAAAVERGG
ncbi:hypothetical protein [Streptomyces sp. NPDC002889]|uniref:hypothetical protein n=1 Tax=Streptomyces sp. NPDC002889 TaxID=3364669 RepID=UPI00369A8742